MASPVPRACAARFRPVQLIASGGYGDVWLAEQAQLDRRVALKLLHPGVVGDRETLERFENEARITAGLRHENIVVVIDHGFDDGVAWIAYEFVPGRTLRDEMAGTPLRLSRALRFARQVAAALEEAHRHGVLHRDIKPENLLVPKGDDVKVADFGLARREGAAAQTREGMIMGTPGYIAPERIRGEPPTTAGDIYAVGVLLYEMLTARLPFGGANPLEMFDSQVREDPRPPSALVPGIPPEVDRLVLEAMARLPSRRTASAKALRVAIDEVREQFGIGEEATTARREPEPPRRTRKPSRRPTLSIVGKARPVLMTLSVLFMLLAVVGLGTRRAAIPAAARPLATPAPVAASAEAATVSAVLAGLAEEVESIALVRNARAAVWAQAPSQMGPEHAHADVTLEIARRFEAELANDLARLSALDGQVQTLRESGGGRHMGVRVLASRVALHRFMLELGRDRNRFILRELEKGNVNTPADFALFLADLELRRIDPLTVGRFQRAAVSYVDAVEAVTAEPQEGGPHLTVLLEDLRWVSYWLYSAGNVAQGERGVALAIQKMVWELDRLPGPVPSVAGRAAHGVWDWSRLGSRSPAGMRSLRAAMADLALLKQLAPTARAGLEEMFSRMSRELEEQQKARHQRH